MAYSEKYEMPYKHTLGICLLVKWVAFLIFLGATILLAPV